MEAGVRGPPGPPAVRLAVTAAAPQEPGNAIAPKLLMVEKLVWDLLQKSNFVLKLAVIIGLHGPNGLAVQRFVASSHSIRGTGSVCWKIM